MTIYPPPQAPPAKCYQCGQTITGAADAHQCRSDAMTDYTDLKRRLEAEIAAIMGPAGADYSVEPVTFYMECKAAIAALEAEVARVSAIAHNAIDEWASWVHDQLDGTSGLDEAIAEVNAARAALADQPAEGKK